MSNDKGYNTHQTSGRPTEVVVAIDIGSTIIKLGAIAKSGSIIFYRYIPIEYAPSLPVDNLQSPLAGGQSHQPTSNQSMSLQMTTEADTSNQNDGSIGSPHVLQSQLQINRTSTNYLHSLKSAPQPVTFSLSETDIGQWFTQIADSIRIATLQYHIVISALIICGQAPTLIALDQNDNPLQPVLFRQSLSQLKPSTASGTTAIQSSFLPLAVHYMQHFPTRYQHIAYWLPIPEYIAYLFGAERCAMIPSHHYEIFYWTTKQIITCGLQPTHFPPHVVTGKPIGTVHHNIATAWNQLRPIPILSGGLDFMFTLIGSNSNDCGIWCDRAGSSYGINIATKHASTTQLFKQYPHPVIPHQYNLSLIINCDISYRITKIIHEATADFLAYTTYIPSQLPPPLALSIKQPGVIHIPSLAHDTPYHSYLIIEALLFIIEAAATELKSLKIPVAEIHLSGGQSRSPAWNMLKAIASGMPTISYQIIDTELVGMATVAWRALGAYNTLEQAATQLSTQQRTYTPSTTSISQLNRRLAERFEIFIDNLLAHQGTLDQKTPLDSH